MTGQRMWMLNLSAPFIHARNSTWENIFINSDKRFLMSRQFRGGSLGPSTKRKTMKEWSGSP
jgi:hemolysin-activating ACP:hemolysin acyltransferase